MATNNDQKNGAGCGTIITAILILGTLAVIGIVLFAGLLNGCASVATK